MNIIKVKDLINSFPCGDKQVEADKRKLIEMLDDPDRFMLCITTRWHDSEFARLCDYLCKGLDVRKGV